MSDEFLKSVLPALLVSLPVFYTTWQNRRQVKLIENRMRAENEKLAAESKKFDADYAGQITDSVIDLLPPYREEIERLRVRIEKLDMVISSNAEKMRGYETLLSEQEINCEKRIREYAEKVDVLTARVARYERSSITQGKVISELKNDIARYKNWLSILVAQMNDAGLTPSIEFDIEDDNGKAD